MEYIFALIFPGECPKCKTLDRFILGKKDTDNDYFVPSGKCPHCGIAFYHRKTKNLLSLGDN